MKMNTERQLSQSLPDHVILSEIDDDGDDADDDDDDDNGRNCSNGDGTDKSDKHLKHDSFIRRYNDRFDQYDRFHGFRSSYKRAMENFDTTPNDSPTMGRSDLQYYRKSKTKNITNKSDPIITQKVHSEEDIIMDYTKWNMNDSERDYNEVNNLPITYERKSSVEFVKRRRLSFRRKVLTTRRAVKKSGDINIRVYNITRSVKYLKDFVTTLIDEQWRYTLTIFTLSYFVIWLVFGLLFYWVGYRHGDLDIDELTGEKLDNSTIPCIMRCQTFIGFLLLSIETQTTIGFGSKYPSEECPETITLIVIQMIVSTAIEGAMIGIVYTKMIRPPKRTRDYTFSRKAVVCMRDSQLCLVFRIDDPKRNHSIETKVEAFWLGPKTTEEGEHIAHYQYSLKLENDGMVSLLWPQTIAHIINEKSPLYDFSAKDFLDKKFEVIVSISGSSRSTGQVTQSLASYLSKEIMWGHRFVNIISFDSEKQTYLADYNRFDATEMIPTALCSAYRLDEVIDEYKFQQYKENSFDSENLDN